MCRAPASIAFSVVLTVFAAQATTAPLAACIDNDGDGFGVLGDPSCPAGAVPDCNDGYASVYPGAPEVCDGLNNDCDHPYWPEVAYWHEQVISSTVGGAQSVFAADLDGDGDVDALSAAYDSDEIAWHENLDGAGSAWTEHVVSVAPELATKPDGPRSVFAADVDGDGDADLLSASENDDRVVWWENENGDGSNWAWHVISTTADGARSVAAADIDGDDDVDVLSASFDDSKIAWYENVSGDGSVWTEQVITTTALGAIAVHVADVDGDGALDVLSASYNDGVLAWHENSLGDGSSWTRHEIGTASGAQSAFAADVDGDGDQDAILGAFVADTVAWYENTSGDGSSWDEHVITTSANGATSVFAVDMDADQDTDVLSASANNHRISWYPNFFGDGSAWLTKTISTTAQGATSVLALDLDGDGDMDALSASADDNTIAWYAWLSIEADDDGDGLAECDGDCDDANPRCELDCTDADGDGHCVTSDCDDSVFQCTVDCGADSDGDGVTCLDDCDDSNPHCATDCTDSDGDGFCVTTDCDDQEPQCTLDCFADADGDGVSCLDDCNDLDPCFGVDCEDPIPGCGPYCPDGVPVATLPDSDEDGTPDCEDNCPLTPNDQSDADGNGVGDPCDCGLNITTDEDGDDGECETDCTLREALSLAVTGCGIRVPAGHYSLGLGYLPLRGAGTPDDLRLSLFGVGTAYSVLVGAGEDPTLGVSTPDRKVELYLGGLQVTHGGNGDGVTIVNEKDHSVELRLNHMLFTGIDSQALEVAAPSEFGLYIRYTLIHSAVTDNGTGIRLRGSNSSSYSASCLLSYSEVRGNATGIRSDGGYALGGEGGHVSISYSSIDENDVGIWAEGGRGQNSDGASVGVADSTIAGNATGVVGTGGDGINSDGARITITQSEVRDNSGIGVSLRSGCSDCDGGYAIFRRSTVRDNGGAGISIEGPPGTPASAWVEYSTVSGNSNGGVHNSGILGALNSTFSGNVAEGYGGAIRNTGTADTELNFVTIAENHAARGGGIYDDEGAGTVQAANTVIANNTAAQGPDCFATLTSNGYNLLEDASDCGIVGETTNIVGVDPSLGPLQSNGAWTRTHLPTLDSPLVEAGNPAPFGTEPYACHYQDQRRVNRPQYTWCDIGSVEHGPGDCPDGDRDDDGVCDGDDNCPGAPNPDQGPAPLGQTIYATSASEFNWEFAVDVVRMRGDLGLVDVYAVDWVDTIPECDSLSDADEPDPGSGFYYLLRPDCVTGSWQTEPGSQPDRDGTLP